MARSPYVMDPAMLDAYRRAVEQAEAIQRAVSSATINAAALRLATTSSLDPSALRALGVSREVMVGYEAAARQAMLDSERLSAMAASLPEPHLVQKVTAETASWKALLDSSSGLSLRAAAAVQASGAWQTSVAMVLKRAHELDLLKTHPALTSRLMRPSSTFSRFARATTVEIENSTPQEQVRLSTALQILDREAIMGAEALTQVVGRPAGPDVVSRPPRLVAFRLVRDEVLGLAELDPEQPLDRLIQIIPSAATMGTAYEVIRLVKQCNDAAKLRGDDEIFRPTNRSMEAAADLPALAALGEQSFGQIVDHLFFLLYEGAGDDNLRFLRYVSRDDCGAVWNLKQLRNVYLRHDPDHGSAADRRKKWNNLGATFASLGLDHSPRSGEDYRAMHRALLGQLRDFLVRLRNVIESR